MFLSDLNIHTADGRVRGIPADPTLPPAGAAYQGGVAFDPVNQAVFFAGGVPPSGPPTVDETFPYADGELQLVSGGEWIRYNRSGSAGGYNVASNVLIGGGAGDCFYISAVSPEYENHAQYIEVTVDTPEDWQAIGVNATELNVNELQAFGIKLNATGIIEWCYISGGITADGNSGFSIVSGDRLGVFFDPAVPDQITIYKNDTLLGSHTFATPPPAGGVPCFGGFSSPNAKYSRVVIAPSAPGTVQLPAPTPTLDAATDQYIGGIRVSATGVLYVSAGPIVSFAPGGIGVDADGVMVVANTVPELFLAGVGMLHDGTVCGMNATGVPPRAFASGFSNGFS